VADPECCICGSRDAVEEHHRDYIPEITVPLCKECHERVHHEDGFGEEYRPKKHEERKSFLRGVRRLLEEFGLETSVYDAILFVVGVLGLREKAIRKAWDESEAAQVLKFLREVAMDLDSDLWDMEKYPKRVADTTGVEPFEKRASKSRSEESGKNMRNDAGENSVTARAEKQSLAEVIYRAWRSLCDFQTQSREEMGMFGLLRGVSERASG